MWTSEIRQMKYKIEYLKGLEIFTYENVSLVGSFANWNEDRRSNVGFQALNEEMEPRRFRYDAVKAITLMNLSNAVSARHKLATHYILNELKLGNVTSLSDLISAPLHSKWPTIRVPLGDWLSYYTAGGKGDTIDEAAFYDLRDIYYHLYLIYHMTGNKEEAKKYINLSYDNVMDLASKLRKSDRNNFLNKNIFNSNIVAAWKQINQ